MTACPDRPRRGVRAAGSSHVGKVRGTNEDRILLEPELGLYAVFDGMGGHAAGEVAAALASDTLCAFFRSQRPATELAPRELLAAGLDAASAAVFERARQQLDYAGMGTTVVACSVVGPARMVFGHVGDSRAYLLRGGRLLQLTRDHTRWIGAGSLPEAAKTYYGGRVLTRGLGRNATAQADVAECDIESGDRVLLCSDGLSASIDAIQDILGSEGSPDQLVEALIELALNDGGADNISAIVIVADIAPRVAS